jgi:Ca-activated chloride channel family protein
MHVEIDESILRDIASKTGGKYFRATDNNKLIQVYNEIDKLEKSLIDVRQFSRKEEKFLLPSLIAFILLAFEVITRQTIYKNLT